MIQYIVITLFVIVSVIVVIGKFAEKQKREMEMQFINKSIDKELIEIEDCITCMHHNGGLNKSTFTNCEVGGCIGLELYVKAYPATVRYKRDKYLKEKYNEVN